MPFVTDLGDNAMAFPLEIGNIPHQLIFLGVAVSAVKADDPPGADAVGPVVDMTFDIPLPPLGLLVDGILVVWISFEFLTLLPTHRH
ncbi:hypothetical protein SynA1562_00320 [Synechococcus sp. A15-62]|uniref:hypothetical protein n=1 Tax=Synechococcus sp. A15-62 TaxID=1050657 RepID=UPI001647660D|nr:hypothetical protein [Synechococcus sp. A15-62]QNI99183.1 hypothetical protein SynA1562_00320 [Synechococcus sp. A15-62]